MSTASRVLLAGFFLCASYAYAQKVNGTIVGTITDSSGSVVPGAG